MRILLTGATGLLGSELLKVLTERGHSVTPFKYRLESKGVEKKYYGRYDWVVHTAALTNVDRCEKEREFCWNVNALGTKTMRDIAKACGARFLYVSTASVFFGDKGNYREKDRPYPQNFYNLSKFAGEIFASEYAKSTIVRLVILGVHASGSRGKNFVEWLADSFINGKDVRLFNDVTINPLSSVTAAEQIADILISKKQRPIVHLTSKDRLTKAEIGRLVSKYFPTYGGQITEASSSSPGATPHPKEMWLNGESSAKFFKLNKPTIKSEIDWMLRRDGNTKKR